VVGIQVGGRSRQLARIDVHRYDADALLGKDQAGTMTPQVIRIRKRVMTERRAKRNLLKPRDQGPAPLSVSPMLRVDVLPLLFLSRTA